MSGAAVLVDEPLRRCDYPACTQRATQGKRNVERYLIVLPDGSSHEVDLCRKHSATLRELAGHAHHTRKKPGRRPGLRDGVARIDDLYHPPVTE